MSFAENQDMIQTVAPEGRDQAVCTENSIRIDWGGNHVTSAHNDRAVMVLANVVRFAVEVQEPGCRSRKSHPGGFAQ